MFYFEIYEPLLAKPDPQNPTRVAIEIRILDRATDEVKSDSGTMQLDLSGNAGRPGNPRGSENALAGTGGGVLPARTYGCRFSQESRQMHG
jgi:hypothetical protein